MELLDINLHNINLPKLHLRMHSKVNHILPIEGTKTVLMLSLHWCKCARAVQLYKYVKQLGQTIFLSG